VGFLPVGFLPVGFLPVGFLPVGFLPVGIITANFISRLDVYFQGEQGGGNDFLALIPEQITTSLCI